MNTSLPQFGHCAFSPYRATLDALGSKQDLASLNLLAEKLGTRHDKGHALRFSCKDVPASAADYERTIFASGQIPTRDNSLHDLLNALVWLGFPRLKSALNIRHCQMLGHAQEREKRGKLRDQLTLLDESGVLVASAKRDLLRLLQEKRWVELFWDARQEVMSDMTFIIVGHGLLQKCLQPFASMTGKCLLLETSEHNPRALDKLAAERILHGPMLALPPLPVLGIPSWDDNDSRHYYENTLVFRSAASAQVAASGMNS